MTADNDNDALPEDQPETNGAEMMAQELSGLKAEVEVHKDRALRALAEVENVQSGWSASGTMPARTASRGLRVTC